MRLGGKGKEGGSGNTVGSRQAQKPAFLLPNIASKELAIMTSLLDQHPAGVTMPRNHVRELW